MRTRLTIMGIVLAAVAAALGTIALLSALFGWPGLAIGVLGAAAVLVAYRLLLQPWQHRWGATDEDVCRAMPGDDLVPDAASTSRVITIAAPLVGDGRPRVAPHAAGAGLVLSPAQHEAGLGAPHES